ncbi:TPA: bacteriohemerythrin [Campylobacter jejuni]|nr:bacteriohemerythrin [Campylobacter jejuni]HEC2817009.1 bacteriohemerythrin [Campylobacter jejuni]
MVPKWNKSFSVHNAKIDAQHKKLFDLAGKVEFMLEKPIYKENLKLLLNEFFDYMKEHFYDEEKYMELIGYPELEQHKKIHKEIIKAMIKIIKNAKTTNDLKEKLYIVSRKWLLEHILYEDMKVERYRMTSLITEDNKEVSFKTIEEEEIKEIKKEKKEEKKEMHLYSCECIGQIHDVPFNIHTKIQLKGVNFKCRKCKKNLKFYKNIF